MRLDTSTDPQVGYRPPGSLDAATALERYAGAFTQRHAAHLARRAGFGGTAAEIDALRALGSGGAVNALLHPTAPEVAFADFPDATLLYDRKQRYATAQRWWVDRMLRTRRPLVEKLTLFWHGHFATSMTKVPPALMVEQIDLFRSQGLGNFRDLLLAVSKNPAMLVWLDNRYNNKRQPNENYAREIMELFALGLGNYTEDDIHNAARAFTGWTLDKDLHYVYKDALHDAGPKTFLGRTGNFTGEDVVAIIVEQPIHQRFICRKLLEFFVYSDPEPELIDGLARTYALSGFNIAQTVGTILRSNVFYSTRAYRALPKSPIEFTIGTLRFMNVRTAPNDTAYWMKRMGQEPLAPPSVKGWDGGPTWINTATLLTRFNYVNRIVRSAPPRASAPPPKPMTALTTSGATTPPAAKAVALAPAGALPSVGAIPPAAAPIVPVDPGTFPGFTPDDVVRQAGGLDAQRVLATIVDDAVQDDVTSDVRKTLSDYLQSTDAALPTPFGSENYQDKIRGVLALVLNLPSNQLN